MLRKWRLRPSQWTWVVTAELPSFCPPSLGQRKTPSRLLRPVDVGRNELGEHGGRADDRLRIAVPGGPLTLPNVPIEQPYRHEVVILQARGRRGITTRRLLCPWYQAKTEPSPAGMLAKLRREFPNARFSAIRPGRNPPDQIGDYSWACDITAA
ncbi:MAG: hypothetical protein ACREOE_10895 [Gemmatimonadales bacterium]